MSQIEPTHEHSNTRVSRTKISTRLSLKRLDDRRSFDIKPVVHLLTETTEKRGLAQHAQFSSFRLTHASAESPVFSFGRLLGLAAMRRACPIEFKLETFLRGIVMHDGCACTRGEREFHETRQITCALANSKRLDGSYGPGQ